MFTILMNVNLAIFNLLPIPVLDGGQMLLRHHRQAPRPPLPVNFILTTRHVPLVADIHFKPDAAMEAVKWVEKVRVNPGNYADKKKFAVKEYTDAEYAAELAASRSSSCPLVKALHPPRPRHAHRHQPRLASATAS
jgi:hypothetical protein